ncbi:hypothetical protein KAX02_02970 [candidate division WOR-3 bacterium]|nr:hypothetical protein [candidate division WOR-3 bacterium]
MLWEKIKIELTTQMLGTVTKDPEVYKTYIESKKPDNISEDEYLTVEKIEEKGWTGFHKDLNGLFIYEYTIKGFLKHAGNVLKDIVKIKNLRSKIDNYVFISPRRIYLNQDKPDGVIERPLRAMTALGPRVTIARSDYIKAGKEIDFKIMLVQHKEITMKKIMELFKYGELMGLGQFRNGGYGRFKVL